MLVECGFVRVQTEDGAEFTFTPSIGRIAALGSPTEIVEAYAALHGPDAAQEAAHVLAGLCDQEDPTPLLGWLEEQRPDAAGLIRFERRGGSMPDAEMIIVARHLMQHGICGQQRPGAGAAGARGGRFSPRFDAAEYVAAARVHLGLSSADAEALSMTELQRMLEMRFPEFDAAERNVPTREEYDAHMAAFEARRSAAMMGGAGV